MARYTIEDLKEKVKLKAGSFISEGVPKELGSGEAYYDPALKKWFSGKLNALNVVVPVEMVDLDELNEALNSIVAQEKLRFALYPFEAKDNWFLHNGICCPAPIGYDFTVVEWKIGTIPTSALNGTNNSIIDYMSLLASPVIAQGGLSNLSTIAVNKNYHAGKGIGLYFNGRITPRLIHVMAGGNSISSKNMEGPGNPDSGNGTPLNKLYVAEVTIQPYSGTIFNEE